VVGAVDLKFDSISSSVALGPRVSSGRTTSVAQPARTGVPTSSEGTIRGSDQVCHVHVLSGSTPREIEVVDGDG